MQAILEILDSSFQRDRDFLPRFFMLTRRLLLAVAILTILCGGCSTNYYTYSGSGIYQGTGGAAKNIDGVDIWLTGTPPRKYKIIGYITDSRPGGAIPMARRDADLAAEAKKNGGDGILLKAEQTNYLGSYSTGKRDGFP
jgi:hypothetical protein